MHSGASQPEVAFLLLHVMKHSECNPLCALEEQLREARVYSSRFPLL